VAPTSRTEFAVFEQSGSRASRPRQNKKRPRKLLDHKQIEALVMIRMAKIADA
jgi:hypothetical protein